MAITVTGLSHHTSSLPLRERMNLSAEALPRALHRLKRRFPDGGAVILSTCNRVEIYLDTNETAEEAHREARHFFSEWHGINEAAFSESLYDFHDREAVAHLFRVASSLDSLVVGEGQILGQVHDAYLAAHAESATDKILSGMFQRAFKLAKEVRTNTNISVGKVSVASIAVDLAVSIFNDLADKTVMVIGSGETGELALKSLMERGVVNVIVANRNLENAQALAAANRGEAVPLSAIGQHLHRADIIISSTAAPEVILTADDFHRALRQRDKEPMFAIDIAVPRDIDRAVNDLDNVYLYDMDDLQQAADQNLELRRAEIAVCMEIVDAHVDRFMQWLQGLQAEPTIVSMSQELHAIRERELKKTLATLSDLTPKQRDEVEYLSKRIVNNILQRPLAHLKQGVADEDPHRVLHLIKRLFGLEEGNT